MRSPFVFDRIVIGDTFMDRKAETCSLSDNFCNLTNTVLISPRRWGKSSLVRRACDRAAFRDERLHISTWTFSMCVPNTMSISISLRPTRKDADTYTTEHVACNCSRRKAFGKAITMEDPIYAWWLKNIYFA